MPELTARNHVRGGGGFFMAVVWCNRNWARETGNDLNSLTLLKSPCFWGFSRVKVRVDIRAATSTLAGLLSDWLPARESGRRNFTLLTYSLIV